jgi:DHA1 family chloramphenicol resistance protein-like MFS transporter
MAAGAPLTAALARRWPTRASLLGFVLVFAAAHLAGAVTTSFPALLVTRVVAALANAGFLAAALTAAAALVAPDRKGRALAVLLAGTTVATIAGVPGGAVLGSLLGWRATFWAIVILCLPAAFGVVKGFPVPVPAAAPSLRSEIRQLAKPKLALVMVLGALVNAATFATFTFLAPIVTGWPSRGCRSRWCCSGSGRSPGSPSRGGCPMGGPAWCSRSAGRCCCSAGSRWPCSPPSRSLCWSWCSSRARCRSRWAAR